MKDYKVVENITEDAVIVQIKILPLMILLLAVSFIPIWLLYDINRIKFEFLNLFEWPIILAVFLGGIFIHELLHGIGWMIAGKVSWHKMKFGFNWKGMVPYAHCSEPMPLSRYMVGVLLPFVGVGVLPWVLGLFLNNFLLLFIGMIFSFSAAGDIYMAWLLRKHKAEDLVLDHPELIGCQIIEIVKNDPT